MYPMDCDAVEQTCTAGPSDTHPAPTNNTLAGGEQTDALQSDDIKSIPYETTAVANLPRRTTTVGHEPPVLPPDVAFPPTFHLYDRTRLRWRPHVYLGARKGHPSHCITPHRKGWVSLHQGPGKQDRIAARYVHPCAGRSAGATPHVALPPGRGGDRPPPVPLRGSFPYRFQMDVPAPGGGGTTAAAATTRAEAFEWRRSRGGAVRRTGRRSGYKLVRLSTDAGAGGGALASGGGEVMAVLALRPGSSARSRAGVFMFQGSGAQGVLGEQWQLVAVMTAVGIWDHRRRRRQQLALL